MVKQGMAAQDGVVDDAQWLPGDGVFDRGFVGHWHVASLNGQRTGENSFLIQFPRALRKGWEEDPRDPAATKRSTAPAFARSGRQPNPEPVTGKSISNGKGAADEFLLVLPDGCQCWQVRAELDGAVSKARPTAPFSERLVDLSQVVIRHGTFHGRSQPHHGRAASQQLRTRQ